MERVSMSRPVLPPEAGTYLTDAFNPNNAWLKTADPQLQKEAMRQWFEARYQDPAIDTPMEDGEYIYVNGGPYHASDLLHSRFSGYIDEQLLDEVSEELSVDSWDWVPKRSEEFDIDFDLGLLIAPSTREAPLYLFNHRMEELGELTNLNIESNHASLLRHMLYGAYISALEAYLAETMGYWVEANEGVLKKFVKTHPEFKNQKISVAEVLEKAASMGAAVEDRLNRQVWHRFNDVRLMFQDALSIKMPPIGELMKAVQIRHDIVHRAGRQRKSPSGGSMPHDLKVEDVEALAALVKEFVAAIEKELSEKFPGEPLDF